MLYDLLNAILPSLLYVPFVETLLFSIGGTIAGWNKYFSVDAVDPESLFVPHRHIPIP